MKIKVLIAALGVLALSALPILAEEEDFKWTGRMSSGQVLTIKGVNGDVEAEPSASDSVEVLAMKRGRRSDPSQVEIEVIEHGDGITVCAVYPTPRGKEPNECLPFGQGRMSTRNNDVVVDFLIRVPADVDFTGITVNGKVKALDLAGNVDARTVNGGINIRTEGFAQATTVNGSISAQMGRADWEGDLDFKTVNGSITLNFPSDLQTHVRAETLNGSIRSDFDVGGSRRASFRQGGRKRKLNGSIGSRESGRELRLETVNGSVKIRRGRVLR